MRKAVRHILNPELPLRSRMFQLLSTIALIIRPRRPP